MKNTLIVLCLLVSISSAHSADSKSNAFLSGFGVTRIFASQTEQTGAGFRPRLEMSQSYGVTFFHDMAAKQQWIVGHMYGLVSQHTGTSEYYFNPTSGGVMQGSGVKSNVFSAELGAGVRYRPFPSMILTPLVGAGVLAGFNRIHYNDPSMSTKVSGQPLAKINVLLKGGMYAEAGIDIRAPDGPGIEIYATRKYTRTLQARTLNHQYLNYWTNEVTACVVVPF